MKPTNNPGALAGATGADFAFHANAVGMPIIALQTQCYNALGYDLARVPKTLDVQKLKKGRALSERQASRALNFSSQHRGVNYART